MYAWLLPAIKAVLPHVGTIVAAALPVFKSRRIDEREAPPEDVVLQQQIIELQEVASQNATHIKELAEQLAQMVVTLERAAIENERRYRRMAVLSCVAVACSVIAIGLWANAG